jgi:phenylpyruvate tautomerase PptA (4-oxalocrotonate tautomerase family)
MPLVRIALRRGKPAAYRRAIRDGVYLAMVESFGVPERDRFILVSEHDEDDFDVSPDYMDIQRSADAIIIQITARNTRTTDQKKTFFAALVERLKADPGIRPEDVFISLIGVEKDDWSFGNGIAQYA